MKIIVLNENSAGTKFGAEHGLSYLIESGGKNYCLILATATFTIVLGHGYWDHWDLFSYGHQMRFDCGPFRNKNGGIHSKKAASNEN